MAKYPSYIATLSPVTNRTIYGTAIAKELQNELLAIQADYASTIGSYGSLASYFSIIYTPGGNIKYHAISHPAIGNITASQHHNKIHGTSHVTGTDPIPLSSSERKGLMTPDQLYVLKTAQSNATSIRMHSGTYVGTGAQFYNSIYLGFMPTFVRILCKNTNFWYRFFGNSSQYLKELHVYQESLALQQSFYFTESGFTCRDDLNVLDYNYIYFAIAETKRVVS